MQHPGTSGTSQTTHQSLHQQLHLEMVDEWASAVTVTDARGIPDLSTLLWEEGNEGSCSWLGQEQSTQDPKRSQSKVL